jgi:hypothetical protein
MSRFRTVSDSFVSSSGSGYPSISGGHGVPRPRRAHLRGERRPAARRPHGAVALARGVVSWWGRGSQADGQDVSWARKVPHHGSVRAAQQDALAGWLDCLCGRPRSVRAASWEGGHAMLDAPQRPKCALQAADCWGAGAPWLSADAAERGRGAWPGLARGEQGAVYVLLPRGMGYGTGLHLPVGPNCGWCGGRASGLGHGLWRHRRVLWGRILMMACQQHGRRTLPPPLPQRGHSARCPAPSLPDASWAGLRAGVAECGNPAHATDRSAAGLPRGAGLPAQ